MIQQVQFAIRKLVYASTGCHRTADGGLFIGLAKCFCAQARRDPRCAHTARSTDRRCEALVALARLRLRGARREEKSLAADELVSFRHQLTDPKDLGKSVQALAKTQFFDAAVVVMKEIDPLVHLKSSRIACSTLMKDCARTSNWAIALSGLQFMQQQSMTLDNVALASAIGVASRGSKWEHALGMISASSLNKLQPDVVVFNAAISACGLCGRWEDAMCLYDSLRQSGHKPTLLTFGAAITACDKGLQWQRALELLSDLQESDGLKVDAVAISAAISACARTAKWRAALKVLVGAEKNSAHFDIGVYNAAIYACERGHEWQWALAVLRKSEECGFLPDSTSYNSAMLACGQGSKWQRALQIFEAERKTRNHVSQIVVSSAMQACQAGSRWQATLGLFQDFCDHLNAMPNYTLDEARNSQSSCHPNIVTTTIAISACGTAALWQRALDIVCAFQRSRSSPDSSLCRNILLCLAKGEQELIAGRFYQDAFRNGWLHSD